MAKTFFDTVEKVLEKENILVRWLFCL